MSNTIRMLPRRWFAPRETMFRMNSAAGMPVRDEIDEIFQGMLAGMAAPWNMEGALSPFERKGDQENMLVPNMDLTSDDKAYSLGLELPGVDPENVSVAVRDDTLVISGEKKRETEEESKDGHVLERIFGSFQRVLRLPEDADAEGITAAHKNGVLRVTIPRKAVSGPVTKTIEVARA